MTRIDLQRSFFSDKERLIVEHAGMTASLFRYDSGVEAVRLTNERGYLIVLPYLGQMLWSAEFDGVPLTMASMFPEPRPAQGILETYGCLSYHAGLLRNGNPGPQDRHALHGEMPCAPMTRAGLSAGVDQAGPYLAVTGEYDHAVGFGAHYLARPLVILRPGSTVFDLVMQVENLSGAPMDVMYMCHLNFAYVPGGRFIQPVPFTPDRMKVRRAIPSHVVASDEYRALIERLAEQPSALEVLDPAASYDPELVFYLENPATDGAGHTHHMLLRPEGDAFTVSYAPKRFPKCVRWILAGADQQVAAFALPSTCEPEGYTAEKAKGNVLSLGSGERLVFAVEAGYLDRAAAAERQSLIASL